MLDLQMLGQVRRVSAGALNDLATHITLRRCIVDYCEILPYEAAKFLGVRHLAIKTVRLSRRCSEIQCGGLEA